MERKELNKLPNAFMLDPRSHTAFDSFAFSIAAETSPYQTTTYRVVTFQDLSYILNSKNTTRTPLNFGRANFDQLPDADLCNLHYAVAKVLHASGAKEAIREFVNDQEDAPRGQSPATTAVTSNADEIPYLNGKFGGNSTVPREKQCSASSEADDIFQVYETVYRGEGWRQRGESPGASFEFRTYEEYLADLERF